MEIKKFKQINNILGIVLLVVSAVVYLMTIEPTTSFWDCGEFIASSYKLEIGHPPGNPVFQLIARFFTLFGGPEQAAVLVNAMSALCSAATIMFLFWTITHIGKRILEKSGRELSLNNAISVFGAGAVGALIYTFSDTFWFSAVEAEVYAMSSLFTAVVFWAMLKWEEVADKPYANRWIVLIAFLMGLSIGVHLLNLLAIPALVFIYYYKKHQVSTKRSWYVLCLSAVILAFVLWGIIPYIPKIAAMFDLLFVNTFGLPFNSGAALFMLLLLASSFLLIWYSYKKKKVLLNNIMLCFTMIIIGYSVFAVIIIRSSANTPTNENQPDNPFSLMRYLGREQYGSNPLIYGETYASAVESLNTSDYWAKSEGRYKRFKGPMEPVYTSESKMFFPRMWYKDAGGRNIRFYEQYTQGRGRLLLGADYRQPPFRDNLAYFFDYQLRWMYFRYFMWNFAGRQNDIQADTPGDLLRGNWESGIGVLDRMRLGDQREGPDYLVNSRAKNHYFMLPLLFGLIGLFYQLKRDKHNWWVTTLLFLLMGVAIVVYLNQPPYQPRERDYAYAGSFYAFAIWTGLAVMALSDFLKKWLPERYSVVGVSLLALLVPIQMGCENWDDHNRSNRYSARDIAYNYLAPLGKQAIIVTHGDNDTFPLWYVQEVENVRTDVRILNTSLLGTDWYIDQMKYKMYDSEPLPISLSRSRYMIGTNDWIRIDDLVNRSVPLKQVTEVLDSNPTLTNSLGERITVFPVRELLVPVNKENALRSGIITEKDMEQVPDTILITIPESHQYMSKTEMIILDIIANYKWDRPIYFNTMGGDINVGIRDYLQYDGFTYKFVPIKSTTEGDVYRKMDADKMYDNVMNVYRWGNLNDPSVNVDYQNLLTFAAVMPVRNIYYQTATTLMERGDTLRAVEVLDKMQEVIIPSQFPLSCSLVGYNANDIPIMGSIQIYILAGEEEKALLLADAYIDELLKEVALYSKIFRGEFLSQDHLAMRLHMIMDLANTFRYTGMEDKAEEVDKIIDEIYEAFGSS